MQIRRNGAWVSVSTAQAFLNGAWRPLVYAKAYISGQWRTVVTFVQPLTVSNSSINQTSSTSGTFSTNVYVSPSGGVPPLSYAWSVQSSTGLTSISLSNATMATATLTATVAGGLGSSGSATLSCTVTDSIGHTATATVTVTLIYKTSTGGG